MPDVRDPKHSLDELAEIGTRHLERVIAVDSQSDERSETVPSTEGQRRLAEALEGFFAGLGYRGSRDESANLLVEVPGNVEGAPKLALLVHMDTARGTLAVPSLEVTPAWDGSRVRYPENDRLQVSVERYPETQVFVGEDLLHGPGRLPIGLDDKLGMSEMMTLAQVLAEDPGIAHGDLVLVCRPDEEIGRMSALEGLARELRVRGVTHAYTIDGLAPFEVNVENFNASRGILRLRGERLDLLPLAKGRVVRLRVTGAKSHGATAKAEGYLNATVVFARAVAPLSRRSDLFPISFQSDLLAETDADLAFLVLGDDEAALDRAEGALVQSFEDVLGPHAWKGAGVEVTGREEADPKAERTDELVRLFVHLAAFLRLEGPAPLLSEDSSGYEGYSNPYFVQAGPGEVRLDYRLRDFTREGLTAREQHLARVAEATPGAPSLEVVQQYVNMGPALAPYPELVAWARAAAERCGARILEQPIRGGTGVDPFLAQGIPVANLGTGYFAPESEKELTSRQNIGKHARWLVHLVQEVARARA